MEKEELGGCLLLAGCIAFILGALFTIIYTLNKREISATHYQAIGQISQCDTRTQRLIRGALQDGKIIEYESNGIWTSARRWVREEEKRSLRGRPAATCPAR